MINLKNIAVLLFSLVVPGLAIAQTEVLYNGIHLPEQWPPRYAEPQKAQDMPKYKFRHFLQQKFGLRMVRVIEEDDNGMIWVGTSEGVCIFHPDSLIADSDDYHLFNYTNGTFC